MLGKLQQPVNLRDIDRRIGRKPNEFCLSGGYWLELLRHKLTLISISDSDTDASMGPGGYEYIIGRYAHDPDMLALFTPAYFKEWQRHQIDYQKAKRRLPGKVIMKVKQPEIGDVLQLLKQVPVVVVGLTCESATAQHFVVAYGVTSSGGIQVYNPGYSGSTTLEVFTQRDFKRRLITDDEIVGVSL